MSSNTLFNRWSNWGPQMQGLLRIVAAWMFMTAGSVKLFGFPYAMPGGHTPAAFSQIWFAGVLELVGGALLLLGLFTRPVAFLLSGEMAVAYFQAHAPKGFFPGQNGGMAAVLFCFLWLYFSAAGAGAWSLDSMRRRRLAEIRNFESPSRGRASNIARTSGGR